jgi:carbamoyltransferase
MVGASAIAEALRRAGLTYVRLTEQELVHQVSRDLAAGRIVGWFQGRSEVGPRALGNRSILADPRDAGMKERLNSRVKQRAWFRPFAPAILEERVTEFFETEQADPFMTMAPKVRADKARLIHAAVHFDGTARIQTVGRSTNPRLYAVIERFADLTGVPVILNTSFNRREPIVQTAEEAISCYLRTQMDVLVVGNFHSLREDLAPLPRRFAELHAPARYDSTTVR